MEGFWIFIMDFELVMIRMSINVNRFFFILIMLLNYC